MLTLFFSSVRADEGMWMPHQMKDLDLEQMGLLMDPSMLTREDGTGLMSAVVWLGGATGEFVSSRGMILTNHHVAFGAIQRASTTENDYITHGFIAENQKEEIPAPGNVADVLLSYHEVTREILENVKPGMTPLERKKAIEEAEKRMIAREEARGEDLRCRVASMYSGNQYYLYVFKRLLDIRLVYAPPRSLGNFGGDIDNWMWPRHTCDFAILRAYVSPEGVGTEYHEDNVPYEPGAVITISAAGLKEGDFTFVMGYPGRTSRHITLAQLQADIKQMEKGIRDRRELIDFLEKAGSGNREIQIKYAGKIKGLNNGLKNYQGKLEGFNRAELVSLKTSYEENFMDWVRADKKRRRAYENVLADIDAFIEDSAEESERFQALGSFLSGYYGSSLMSQAHTLVRNAEESLKSDMERDAAFQQRNRISLRRSIELAERGYDLNTDRKLFMFRLWKWIHDAPETLPSAFQELVALNEEQIRGRVDDWFDRTRLHDAQQRLLWLDSSPEELKESKDPLLLLAMELEKELKVYREKQETRGQQLRDLRKVYLKGLLEMESLLAPDANGTIRFTCGTVEGYYPRDAVYYEPFTTLSGVLEKETGEFPFEVPEKLKTLARDREFGPYADPGLNDIAVCFLNTTSVTGGNSGSPTLNARGEQVGIIFDMTYESVVSDYYIIPEWQRTISVDIRYALFVLDRFSGAGHLLDEMHIRWE